MTFPGRDDRDRLPVASPSELACWARGPFPGHRCLGPQGHPDDESHRFYEGVHWEEWRTPPPVPTRAGRHRFPWAWVRYVIVVAAVWVVVAAVLLVVAGRQP